jgi:hypothetical protein
MDATSLPDQPDLPNRTVVSYARPESYIEYTETILSRLGYHFLSAAAYDDSLPEGGDRGVDAPKADLLVVDERRLGEIPESEDGIPIILLTGRHGVTGADPRIAGAVKRPAGLHDLYRLAQQILEDTPRSVPRVATHLTAHCKRKGKEWTGTVLSLSENGCLLRSPEELPLGSELELAIDLPKRGRVTLWADSAYQLVPDCGLVFSALVAADRAALCDFVKDSLAA